MLLKLLVYLMPQSINGQAFKNSVPTGMLLNDDVLANRIGEPRHLEFRQGSFECHDNDHAGPNRSLDQHLLKNGNILSGVHTGVVAEPSSRRDHITNPYGQTGRMSKPKPTRYRTTNWFDHNAAFRKRGSLLIWLDKEMAWYAPHEGRPGRPPIFSDAAIHVCLSIKVLFKLPLTATSDTRRCHNAIIARGSTAIIPIRKNARP